jgi:hypothetical protein
MTFDLWLVLQIINGNGLLTYWQLADLFKGRPSTQDLALLLTNYLNTSIKSPTNNVKIDPLEK